MLWKLPLQQATQQVGHGHALREGRHLDACPHRGCDVEGQAGGVEVALAQRIVFADSVAAGRLARETVPDSMAAREITALVDELLRWPA